MWGQALGGIGIFLLGMGLLTDGLKKWAGDGLRRFLGRFAGNRYSAAATGVLATALIQSSSATSLITIGLVGAGLVALPNAIAILIGANVGTTATGYLVAFVGLKVSVSAYALPLIGAGAFARIFLHGRKAAVADAVAGFGLLFVGIDLMRNAVGPLAEDLDIARWAGDAWWGALVLIGLGALMTVLVQSSSAAMATTLAALDAGVLDLRHGAYLAIGQNVGTTVTAVVGSLGGSIAARRTALAHVTFNLGTALPALVLAMPLLSVVTNLAGGDNVIALAYFHTAFNLLGLIIFLPLVGVLARKLERALPDKRKNLSVHLDRNALGTSGSVQGAIDATLDGLTAEMVSLLEVRLDSPELPKEWLERLASFDAAHRETKSFMADARREGHTSSRISEQVEALDHLRHMHQDLDEAPDVANPQVQEAIGPFVVGFRRGLTSRDSEALAELHNTRKVLRAGILERVERDANLDPAMATTWLESLHWLDEMARHMSDILSARSRHEGRA